MKNDENITWLQFSDLHIFDSVDWNLMIESYEKLAEQLHPDFIIVTGDYRHKKYEENLDYSKTLDFLEKIVEIFKVKKEDVFLLPGNHDVNDYEGREDFINTIIDNIDDPEKYKNYFAGIKNLKNAFKSYSEFVEKFYKNDITDERVTNPSDVIFLTWKNKINIIILNTALISDGNKEHEEIIDIYKLSKITTNNALPTLVLGHHDFNSICKSQRTRLVTIFKKLNVKAYICGDTHKKELKFIDKYDGFFNQIPCIICGKSAVQPMDDYSDVGVISYSWRTDGYVYVVPYEWGNRFDFKRSDKFLYNLDKDFRFLMSETSKKTDVLKSEEYPIKYPNIIKAHNDIVEDIQQGGYFKFYGLRGATFLGEPEVNDIVNQLKTNRNIQIKFLISYPFSEEIRHRLKEIPECSNNDECEKKWIDTYKKVNDLKFEYKGFRNVDIRFHDTTLLFRLLITDKHLYFGYYEPNINSVNTEIYRFDNNTSSYKTYNSFFDYQWKKARHSLPVNIPAKYSFLKENFSVQPSLVINITSHCNMNCIYCPTGGENLCEIKSEACISKDVLKKLIFAFKKQVEQKGAPTLRITGGEPLINEDNRSKTATILDAAKDYKRIVLCTNGIYLREAYNSHLKEWESVKNKLLLKISLDTLNSICFSKITGTGEKGQDLYKSIIDNIKFISKKGFKIELNLVATKENVQKPEDILSVFEFAKRYKLVGVKVLTVNDFGGKVKIEQSDNEKEHISKILNDVIKELKRREYEEKDVYLNDNKGIQMKRFIAISDTDEKCTLTIVDHNNAVNSITPRRTFSNFCRDCKYFLALEPAKGDNIQPCATGMMSLTLRADGVLSPCRLCPEKGTNIKSIKKRNKMEGIVKKYLKAFDNCFHKGK